MSKKTKRIIIVIALIILTNGITFGLSNSIMIKTGNKVVLNRDDFNLLNNVYKDYEKIDYVKSMIDKQYYKEPDKDLYLEGQLKGLVASLGDPYSQYLNEDEFTQLTEQTDGTFGGIGVIVTPGDDNMITVVSPIEGTPGEKSGIKPGDKIIKVNGEEFSGEDMDKAVKIMKGEPGTDVELSLLRINKSGGSEMIDKTIKREIIKVESVKKDIIEDDIGYIQISSFDKMTHKDFKEALKSLESSNVNGLIIDLRNNPGGLLDVCADIADELLDSGDIVYTENRAGDREYLKSKNGKTDLPLVLLVNQGSASASEILSGAVRDHKRGKIIGETTFGKGLVQRILDFPDGSGMKITISEYFTPNGENIHGEGITPDYEIEIPEDAKGIGLEFMDTDTQMKKAIEVLREQI